MLAPGYLGLLEVPSSKNLGLAGYLLKAQQKKKDCLNSSLCFSVHLEGVQQETFDGEESSLSILNEN